MSFNVGQLLSEAAQRDPYGRALIATQGGRDRFWSFSELDAYADRLGHGLRRLGLRQGDRVLLMVKNGPDFIALTFALFKLGALPVLMDPGMGVKPLLACIDRLAPDALIGVRAALVLKALHPRAFTNVRRTVCADGFFPGATPLPRLLEGEGGPLTPVATEPDHSAAILFTSGSTGPAKGVVYRHGIFQAQVEALRSMFSFEPGGVDMPGFPLFALFSIALGMTCVLPELNPARPATADPRRLVRAIREWQVENLQGSPAIWTRVADYCRERRINLPSVRRVITFGAPISLDLVTAWQSLLGERGDIYTPYGATEALPVSLVSGRELVEECAGPTRSGAGVCVGKPISITRVKVIATRDQDLPVWDESMVLPTGEIGEIVVSGPVVTWAYDGLEAATRAAKIVEGETIWHRMGDLGYLDEQGRLWVVGRKSHRVETGEQTLYPVCLEGMLDDHPDIRRSALVGVGTLGSQLPVAVIEPARPRLLKDPAEQQRLLRDVRARLANHPIYSQVQHALFHPRFPVDNRHNAKIHREELAEWASQQPL